MPRFPLGLGERLSASTRSSPRDSCSSIGSERRPDLQSDLRFAEAPAGRELASAAVGLRKRPAQYCLMANAAVSRELLAVITRGVALTRSQARTSDRRRSAHTPGPS